MRTGNVNAGELARLISELCSREGSHETGIPGLFLTRSSTVEAPRTTLDRAVFCVVAQGSKSTLLNGQRFLYDASKYLLVSLNLPAVGQIEEASRARPFLGLSLVLDFEEIGSLLEEMNLPPLPASRQPLGLTVNPLDDDLLNAVTRLTKLLQKPADLTILAPLLRREIYYRLLASEGSETLRRIAAANGKTQRIAAGLDWLRRNASRPIRMGELARELNMSASTMHSWFRSVTSMSPLQFQKQLRLQNARRLMLSESIDAGTASRRVGYGSASQFSREYRRFFGAPPHTDVARLRSTDGASL